MKVFGEESVRVNLPGQNMLHLIGGNGCIWTVLLRKEREKKIPVADFF